MTISQVKVVVIWKNHSMTTKVFTTKGPVAPDVAANSFVKGIDVADIHSMRLQTEYQKGVTNANGNVGEVLRQTA